MSRLTKIIFSDEIQDLSVAQLKECKPLFAGNPKALKKIEREIAHKTQAATDWLKDYYSNSVGGVSLEKYREAIANDTLRVIKL